MERSLPAGTGTANRGQSRFETVARREAGAHRPERAAGAGAVDCGLVAAGAARSAALDCAEAAFLDGRAFVVGWRSSGRDSPIGFYRAMDAEGTAWALSRGFHGSETRVDRFRCAGDFVRADFGPPVGETFDCPVEPTAVVLCE